MKKEMMILILLPLVGLISCKNKEERSGDSSKVSIAVTTTLVQSSESSNILRYSGTIEAFQTIPLSFQTSGIVEKIFVEVGDAVKKGQLIASVNNADMSNIYNTTFAKYKQAKDGFERLKSLHDQGSLPEIKWVEMVSNMDQAQSMLDLSKNNLEKCNMRAPEDGVIGKKNIEPGQSSISIINSPIEIVKIEKVYIKISVPENEVGKINKGLKAIISVSALNNKQYDGEVVNISPVADEISRTYCIKILVNNPALELKPGMVCDVSLNTGMSKGVVLVPYKAVSKDNDGKTYVFVISSDKKNVKKQIVTTGNYHDSEIEILGGLCIGQTIVNEGKEKLSDNSLINF